jgi:Uma2 family endonuclease
VATVDRYTEITVVPRIAVQLPIALPIPTGFDVERQETWPAVEGRLEFVRGRLEYMPPCGEVQQRVVADVVGQLWHWRSTHDDFVIGTNEAGMLLGGDVRGADAAVWRAAPAQSGFARTPPVLAVEILGKDETIDMMVDKATWYLQHGVEVVWTIDPAARRVRVTTLNGTVDVIDRIPEHPSLPGLSPVVADLFRQI